MSRLVWEYEELVRFTKWEDAEVRYWAVDRLVRLFPDTCVDAVAPFLLDDHDATPTLVARHLGEHGDARHHAILLRGLKLLRGNLPGYCLQALSRLGYPGTVEAASTALQRGDLTESAVGIIVEALADLGTPAARDVVREFVGRKVEALAEPAALRGALKVSGVDDLPDLLGRFLTAVQWRGAQRAGEGFRTLMESLQIDDASWCFRTGPSGRIELRKTIKAVDAAYDCDILGAIDETTIKAFAQRFRAGALDETIQALADWTIEAVTRLPKDPEDDLPARVAAAVRALAAQRVLQDAERLGHQFQQWVVGFQLSAAFAAARYVNVALALKRARGELDRLLDLAEVETAFVLPDLPSAVAVLCRDDTERSAKAQEWCLRMLEAQGPFFPRIVALETLGELRAVHFIPEIMEYLGDENSYVYGAAEHALGKMGEALVGPARSRIESGTVDPDSAHSLLVLLCDLGTRSAYETVAAHLDWFMEEVGPGTTTEWVSLFGAEELIDPLRDWLEEDPAMVGQGVLLLGAIHNVRIPEEDEILRAIEDERERQAREPFEEDDGGGSDNDDGTYVM